ncbi:anhydro-N-acetylmuramic acid kinase [Arenibacter sp. M-2]|uniref:anhydro-N-acetylmuramic acid kinase n=1 Tax=Arenibacter sp. M-2 TaxID=3053612 RepID=UPI002570681D|nr:anhydro-N-acetylmuramic acid kinase [Arenibacter sp. M-2]MDL5514556.1 anhydro-N-acetylmuramic acid kinase [Arenibacter sp. M-2]|tara:strand:+ start:16467 stop:17543 length:1077 start_codon:yes stop_codon:yes gene_type:complete
MKIYKVIGLMSGTSLDGLDLAYCHIWETSNAWDFEIKQTHSISYNEEMQEKLKNSIFLPADQLLRFHNSYGTWLGIQTKEFIESHGLEVDFIASHGHTTHHQPQNGLTFQIGSGQHLANESATKVICDFRTNDLALGGQGAPLVPIGDQLFFGQYHYCLNLGGISNISFEQNGKRRAYDIGLANMILNHITQKIKLNYDKGGSLARTGKINQPMLDRLNNLEFYKLPFPKSIGFEWFVEKVVPIVDSTSDSIENLLHTAIHHICDQIAIQVNTQNNKTNRSLFVTGGGALNTFLMDCLQEKLGPETMVVSPSKTLIEFKEALVFALMGVLREEQKNNCLSSVTGAKRDCYGGVIYLPA